MDDSAADVSAEDNIAVNNLAVDDSAALGPADYTAAVTASVHTVEDPIHDMSDIIQYIMPTSRAATPKATTMQGSSVHPAGQITATSPSPSTPAVASDSRSVASIGVDSTSRRGSSGWNTRSLTGMTTPLTSLEDFIGVQARHIPNKRGASPDGRTPKVPRLTLRDELKAEFEADRQRLREELGAERRQLAEVEAERHREAERSCQTLNLLIEQHLASLYKEWHSKFETNSDILRGKMDRIEATHREDTSRIESRVNEQSARIEAMLGNLQHEVGSATTNATHMEAAMDAAKADLTTELADLAANVHVRADAL